MRDWHENHKTMILLGVDDEAELRWWERRLTDAGVPNHAFVEPDRGGEKTALAVSPGADAEWFGKLQLLN